MRCGSKIEWEQKMNKVCHLTSVHRRYDGRIFRRECASLAKAGYEVALVVADGGIDETKGGISIFNAGRRGSRIKRFFVTNVKVYKKCREVDADVYHFHDPELLFVGLALRRAGKKVIWDMHESIPADIMQKKYIPWPAKVTLNFLYKRLETFAVKRFSGVVTTRESVLHRLNGLNRNLTVVNNFPLAEDTVWRTKTKERIVCFAGAIVPNYQHREIIQALEKIEDVKYLLAGTANPKYLDDLKKLEGWKKVEYLGHVPFEKVMDMYSRSSVAVVVHKYTANMDWRIGNFALTKICETLLWELPVVCTRYSLWEEVIFNRYKCGIMVEPTDIEAIRRGIRHLLDHPREAREMGKDGREAVLKEFSWSSQETKLLNLYGEILSNPD